MLRKINKKLSEGERVQRVVQYRLRRSLDVFPSQELRQELLRRSGIARSSGRVLGVSFVPTDS